MSNLRSSFLKVLFALVLIVIAVVTFQKIQRGADILSILLPPSSKSPTLTPYKKTGLPSDWRTYTSYQKIYTFKHPGNVYIEEFQDAVRASLKEDPEMPAGIVLDFRMGKLPLGQNIKTFVENQVQIAEGDGEISTPLKEVIVNSYTAYFYGFKGIGEEKHYYIPRFDGEMYMHIIDSTADATDQDFKGTADTIVQTFNFVQ